MQTPDAEAAEETREAEVTLAPFSTWMGLNSLARLSAVDHTILHNPSHEVCRCCSILLIFI